MSERADLLSGIAEKIDDFVGGRDVSRYKTMQRMLLGHLRRSGVDQCEYGLCINAIYKGLFGVNSVELRERIGMKKSASIRKSLDKTMEAALTLAECRAIERIEMVNALGVSECIDCAFNAGRSVAIEFLVNDK